jgi:hypothetical protein
VGRPALATTIFPTPKEFSRLSGRHSLKVEGGIEGAHPRLLPLVDNHRDPTVVQSHQAGLVRAQPEHPGEVDAIDHMMGNDQEGLPGISPPG